MGATIPSHLRPPRRHSPEARQRPTVRQGCRRGPAPLEAVQPSGRESQGFRLGGRGALLARRQPLGVAQQLFDGQAVGAVTCDFVLCCPFPPARAASDAAAAFVSAGSTHPYPAPTAAPAADKYDALRRLDSSSSRAGRNRRPHKRQQLVSGLPCAAAAERVPRFLRLGLGAAIDRSASPGPQQGAPLTT